MRRVKYLVPAVAVLVASVALFGSGKSVAAAPPAGSGSISNSGWVTLPLFPSGGEISGVVAHLCADGIAVDSAGVVHHYNDGANISTTPGVTVCSNGGPSLTTTFSYDEPCAAGSAGFAEGSITLAGDPDTEYFGWARAGNTAAIQLSDDVIVGPDPPVASDPDGASSSSFAPVLSAGNITGCGTTPVSALVAGTGSWTED